MSDCDKRPCIVEMLRPDRNKWSQVAIEVFDRPMVFKCTCQAEVAIGMIWIDILNQVVSGAMRVEDAPVDSRIVYVDKEPASLDAAVSDTTQANDIINKIMGKS